MVHLEPITRHNFKTCIKLSVSKEQESFVASNVYSLAQAYAQRECKPYAIYSDDTMVGFIMYCIDHEDNQYWVYRLMIDVSFQNMSYGRQALAQVIKRIKKDKSHNRIFISAAKENAAALKMYESMGFYYTGKVQHDEFVMRMDY